MTQEELIEINSLIDREDSKSLVEAFNYCASLSGSDKAGSTKEAYQGLYSLFQILLDSEQYIEAALLIWGRDLFDPRPKSVQRIWNALMTEPKVLIPGGSSQGKSYTPAAWSVLNWVRDPAFTSGKVLSVTATHAAENLMATIKMFHERSALRLPGQRMDKAIILGNGDRRASITLVAIPPGESGWARVRGFHPVPRPKSHPQFGKTTRIFALLDEGEDGAAGIWEGFDNLTATRTRSASGHLIITIASGANPKKRESPYAQRAEFPGGWGNFNLETDLEWRGPDKLGNWLVVRLDPAKSENIIEQKVVYDGMMDYPAYRDLLKQGVNSPQYLTFGRGAWPTGTTEFYITPQDYFNNSIGIYLWDGMPSPLATLDPAFAAGGDNPVLTTGRFGKVVGFTPWNDPTIPAEYHKPFQDFRDRPFNGLQIEQQLLITKDNTLVMAREVMNYLRELNVRPEWFACDTTGNGIGIHDAINLQFNGILGIQWSSAATERKILDEDTKTAEERFSGVHTEMMFAFATWLQYGYIKFAPLMDASKLTTQATGRKFFYDGRGLIRAQSKEDFKSETGGSSPDEYDSAIQMTHLVRVRKSQNAAMLPDHPKAEARRSGDIWGNVPKSSISSLESYTI